MIISYGMSFYESNSSERKNPTRFLSKYFESKEALVYV
jgi:hypothetical protein